MFTLKTNSRALKCKKIEFNFLPSLYVVDERVLKTQCLELFNFNKGLTRGRFKHFCKCWDVIKNLILYYLLIYTIINIESPCVRAP